MHCNQRVGLEEGHVSGYWGLTKTNGGEKWQRCINLWFMKRLIKTTRVIQIWLDATSLGPTYRDISCDPNQADSVMTRNQPKWATTYEIRSLLFSLINFKYRQFDWINFIMIMCFGVNCSSINLDLDSDSFTSYTFL